MAHSVYNHSATVWARGKKRWPTSYTTTTEARGVTSGKTWLGTKSTSGGLVSISAERPSWVHSRGRRIKRSLVRADRGSRPDGKGALKYKRERLSNSFSI